jgi:hypothetical protein
MLPPFSGLKSKPGASMKAGFLLGLFFDAENGGDIFLRNVG